MFRCVNRWLIQNYLLSCVVVQYNNYKWVILKKRKPVINNFLRIGEGKIILHDLQFLKKPSPYAKKIHSVY